MIALMFEYFNEGKLSIVEDCWGDNDCMLIFLET